MFARARRQRLNDDDDDDDDDDDEKESDSLPDGVANTTSDTKCLVGHRGPVYSVGYMPNNTDYLLSCGEDTTLRIWDVESQSNKAVYEGHSYPVWCLDVDRLGIYVATGRHSSNALNLSSDRYIILFKFSIPMHCYLEGLKDSFLIFMQRYRLQLVLLKIVYTLFKPNQTYLRREIII